MTFNYITETDATHHNQVNFTEYQNHTNLTYRCDPWSHSGGLQITNFSNSQLRSIFKPLTDESQHKLQSQTTSLMLSKWYKYQATTNLTYRCDPWSHSGGLQITNFSNSQLRSIFKPLTDESQHKLQSQTTSLMLSKWYKYQATTNLTYRCDPWSHSGGLQITNFSNSQLRSILKPLTDESQHKLQSQTTSLMLSKWYKYQATTNLTYRCDPWSHSGGLQITNFSNSQLRSILKPLTDESQHKLQSQTTSLLLSKWYKYQATTMKLISFNIKSLFTSNC